LLNKRTADLRKRSVNKATLDRSSC